MIAANPFLKHTTLPPQSGGPAPGDTQRRYEHVSTLDAVLHPEGTPPEQRTDRVYKNPDTGRFFKVRLYRIDVQGRVSVGDTACMVSVAQCDAQGWALPHDTLGFKICPEETLNIPGDALAEDVAAVLASIEQHRLIMCASAELRVRNEEAAALLPTRA